MASSAAIIICRAGRLMRNVIGQGEIARTAPFRYSLNESQDIGDEGTPVDFTYQPPFAFKGAISRMVVELK